MAHVELSLSGAFVPQARTPSESEFIPGAQFATGIDRWTATVSSAVEPCLIVDSSSRILALSMTCSELLGLGNSADAVGRPLLGGVLRLIDFTAVRGELTEPETEKIPPVLAVSSQRLTRGLMRVQPGGRGVDITVDAISTPLWEAGQVVASLTFFSPVPR